MGTGKDRIAAAGGRLLSLDCCLTPDPRSWDPSC